MPGVVMGSIVAKIQKRPEVQHDLWQPGNLRPRKDVFQWDGVTLSFRDAINDASIGEGLRAKWQSLLNWFGILQGGDGQVSYVRRRHKAMEAIGVTNDGKLLRSLF